MKAVIYQSELDVIGRHTLDFPRTETGGDLFGFWTHSGFPVIQLAIGPGSQARRSATAFYQDAAHLRRAGAELRRFHGLQHIGEWHSHHRLGLEEPSAGDADTVVHALEGSDLGQFFLTIMTLRELGPSVVPTARGYLFRRATGSRYASCGWVVLPGESPIRRDSRLAGVLIPSPRSSCVNCHAEPRTTLEAPCAAAVPLRPDSWALTARGISLLKAVRGQLASQGDVRLGATTDGLVEAFWAVDGTRWRLAFANDASLLSAAATLRWSDDARSGSLDLCGSMAEVLADVHAHVEAVVDGLDPEDLSITDDTLLEIVPQPPRRSRPGRLVRHEEPSPRSRQGMLASMLQDLRPKR